jgi:hypothetical protein
VKKIQSQTTTIEATGPMGASAASASIPGAPHPRDRRVGEPSRCPRGATLRAYPRNGNPRARVRADPGNGLAARILTVDHRSSRRKYKPAGGLLHLLALPGPCPSKKPGVIDH